MKKILSILGALTLSSIAASSVVACGGEIKLGTVDTKLTELDGVKKDLTVTYDSSKENDPKYSSREEHIGMYIMSTYSTDYKVVESTVENVLNETYKSYIATSARGYISLAKNAIKNFKLDGFEESEFDSPSLESAVNVVNKFVSKLNGRQLLDRLYGGNSAKEVQDDQISNYLSLIYKHLFLVDSKGEGESKEYYLYWGSYVDDGSKSQLKYNNGMKLNVTFKEPENKS
ncbi:hypothetical protein SGLAD_v1c09630 [Spiroplasma gladiatoris]|uniref:Lipoprotein n=1 Tax=Spiroplasma gladiatoris TaxID=2143 RepID=A0A4P7AIR6_9MOLU|nr:lipoprotein [Spiroplasma gladiatoris]QBQ08162.1 hypothetical protein SGLAD_v1c09630 [Spiroplasma gladiatoris]